MTKRFPIALAAAATMFSATPFAAAFDPAAGDWTKESASQVRVVTWNIRNSIAQNEATTNLFNKWNAAVRVVAALEADVLLLQEVGDGSSVSSYQALFDRFINGGIDPNTGQPVEVYLKLFKPDLDYFVYVPNISDGFNRNVILSRFPFTDLNNDVQQSAFTDNIVLFSDKYAQGISAPSDAQIRGIQFAEIDLPDAIFSGDLVVGNMHLKAFSGCPEADAREAGAQNAAYWIDHFYNGAGTGSPDPNNKIPFDGANTTILGDDTPVIWGGDINQEFFEVEFCNTQSPAQWMVRAQQFGGTDGTDRDRSDAAFDSAADPFNPANNDSRGSRDIDFLFWQDSIASAANQVILDTAWINNAGAPFPFPIDGFVSPISVTGFVSDHRPVIVDFDLPLVPPPPACDGDVNGDGNTTPLDISIVLSNFGATGVTLADGDVTGDGQVTPLDISLVLSDFGCSAP